MGIQFVALHHIERNSTMSKKQLSRFVVDGSRIGHEAGDAKQCAHNSHRKHGGHVAFTACHVAGSIEARQRQATRVVQTVYEIETAQGEALQLMILNDFLQSCIDTVVTG